MLRKLAGVYDHVDIDPSPIRNKIREIISSFEHKFAELDLEKERSLDRIESGDDIDPGIIKQVKVYIASKRKLSVGDKVAGRRGNKGGRGEDRSGGRHAISARRHAGRNRLEPVGSTKPNERWSSAGDSPRCGRQSAWLQSCDAGF